MSNNIKQGKFIEHFINYKLSKCQFRERDFESKFEYQ
jgi:hypothetical protein